MDSVHKNEYLDKFMNEFTSRIVAETGIPSDKYHLGKIILQSLKDDPEFVMQIDGGTGESETNGSVLRRSIQCATALTNMGLKKGDVIILMAPHHLDLCIPFYAALYLGIIAGPVDRFLGVYELKATFDNDKPKIVFCQSEKVQDVRKAIDLLGLDTQIISFDTSPDTLSFSEMMEKHGRNADVQNFVATDFDPEEAIAFMIPTSGTTGLPKAAAVTHKILAIGTPSVCAFSNNFPKPTKAVLIVSPLQWLSALANYLVGAYFRYTRIQSSLTITTEHTFELIKKYEPTFVVMSPTMMTTLYNSAEKENCNFSSFEIIYLGGSAVPPKLIEDLKRLTPKTQVTDTYGMSELGSLAFFPLHCPRGSCGKRLNHLQYKLVNLETDDEITAPYESGELWIKLACAFKGYYNNPEVTAEMFTKDQWMMTGDTMYRDESWNFYFVERIKSVLKYRNHQISPVEVELVIRQHPGILDVAVVGIPDAECGDLPVACVVTRPGAGVTAQEIQELVKEKLTDTKQLRGGVVFLTELPLTASTKINRRKLKEMVMAGIPTVNNTD